MEVKLEEQSQLRRAMHISIPNVVIEQQINDKLTTLAKNKKIPGFRPGNAPISIIRQHYGEQVRNEVLGNKIEESLRHALEEQKISPVTPPQISSIDTHQKNGLRYTATFDVYPEIDITELAQIKVPNNVCKIQEEDVDKIVDRLARDHGTLEKQERKIKQGDVVIIDYTVYIEKEEKPIVEQKDVAVEIGTGSFFADIEKKMVGLNNGDKQEAAMELPTSYPKEYAGKTGKVQFEIKSVNQLKRPELNEAFFEKIHIAAKTIEEFKNIIQKNMLDEANKMLQGKNRQEVYSAISQHFKNKFPLPVSLIEQERETLEKEYQEKLKRMEQQNTSTVERPPNMESIIENRVLIQLVVREVMHKNKIRVEQQDLQQAISDAAAAYKDPNAVIEWYYKDQRRLQMMEIQVLEKKAVDKILEQVQITEQAVSFDELFQNQVGHAA